MDDWGYGGGRGMGGPRYGAVAGGIGRKPQRARRR